MSPDDDDPSSLFSDHQRRILVIIPGVAAALSVIGSLGVLHTLLVDPEERKHSPFRRLFLGISIMDLFFSAPHVFMGGWAVPKDDWTSSFARGNLTSCNLMGFLIVFGVVGQLLYSASLALYHVLVVRFRWHCSAIAKRIEPFWHGGSVLVPLGFAVGLWRTDFINSNHLDPGTCVASTNPPNCLQQVSVECVRGDDYRRAHNVTIVLYSIMVLFTWIIAIWGYGMLWLEVRSTERRMQRYGRASSRAATFFMTRKVGNQGMMYVGCFTICNLWTLIRILVLYPLFETTSTHRGLYFGMQIVSLPMLQLQGFFHALVFFSPRWRSLLQPGRGWAAIGRYIRDDSSESKEMDDDEESSTEFDQEPEQIESRNISGRSS